MPKLAKDGSHRGRPALFGEAGRYERLYAEVTPEIARVIRDLAKAKKQSLSSILAPVAAGPISLPLLPLVKGTVRIYVQIGMAVSRRLKAEARRRGWAIAALLGSLATYHFTQPEEKRIAT